MSTNRRVLTWSAIAILGAVTGACTFVTQQAPEDYRSDAGAFRMTRAERQRQARDSAIAQALADEVGPRVTIRADFENAAGSRRVEATFHMYDDAYVVVGHLDAAGRMRIVFPNSPDDDGFVRGDKVYHIPSFFAGFVDEYAYQYSLYRYRAFSLASRRDSYDAGLGYVFIVASWRPLRLDRIADGNRWETYEVADLNYLQDPREAIEELGAVVAGDNREAYTIEYARYYTTNYGMYSMSAFDLLNSCYANSSFGLSPFAYSPFGYFSSFASGFGLGSCGRRRSYVAYGGYGYTYPPSRPAPPIITPPNGPLPTPTIPIFHRPRTGGDAPSTPPGTPIAQHRPREEPATAGTNQPATQHVETGGAQPYHRPGLITEDAGDRRGTRGGQSARRPMASDTYRPERPSLAEMVSRRRFDEETRTQSSRAGNDEAWSRVGASRQRPADNGGRWNDEGTARVRGGTSRVSGGTSRGSDRGVSSGAYSPRGDGGRRETPRGESPRSEPRHETPRSSPAPSRAEPASRPSSPPAASPRSEPAKTETRKPGA